MRYPVLQESPEPYTTHEELLAWINGAGLVRRSDVITLGEDLEDEEELEDDD